MAIDRDRLYDGTEDLLDRLADRLPERDLETFRSLHDVGEPIYLLNLLCAGLIKWRTELTPGERELLAELVSDLAIPKERYEFLDDPAGTLARLTVTE
jgi:hypothetical protein